jgi:APA family basic amino acid/polyamine antiporter
MTRDGLLPRGFGALSRRRTPARMTLTFGLLIAVLAAFVPLTEIAKLVNRHPRMRAPPPPSGSETTS